MRAATGLVMALSLTLVVVSMVLVLDALELRDLERRIDALCDLKIVIPVDGPTEIEAFPNRQRFPEWCGADPHDPSGIRFET